MSHKSTTPDVDQRQKPSAAACAVHASLSDFLHALTDGDIRSAARVLRSADPTWSKQMWPVRIGHLVRFVDEWQRSHKAKEVAIKPWRKERVAVIGAGNAGLVCAGTLARQGYPVTIYEGVESPGGVLRYSTSESDLSQKILDWEIEILKRLGVEIHCNAVVGETLKLEDLTQTMGYSAVFVATGHGLAHSLGDGHSLNPLHVDKPTGDRQGAFLIQESECLDKGGKVDAADHAAAGGGSVIQSASAGKAAATKIHEELTEEAWATEEVETEWDEFINWCREEEHAVHE